MRQRYWAGIRSKRTVVGLLLLGGGLACSFGRSEQEASTDSGQAEGLSEGLATTAGPAASEVMTFVTQCAPGEVACEGGVAIPCDSTAVTTRDCAAEGLDCLEPFGCQVCTPGEGSCTSGRAQYCNDRGTAFVHFDCDPEQGMVCEVGGCTGSCSPAVLRDGYVGCDYFPTVTPNPVFDGFEFAVAVANAGEATAEVEVTRQGLVVASHTVPPGQLQRIALPWVESLKGGQQDACQVPPGPQATSVVPGGAYRLKSTSPVSVYQFNPLQYELSPSPPQCPLRNDCPRAVARPDEGCLSFSNDATLLYPSNVLTASYSVLSWPSGAAGQSFASVVATKDNTEVWVSATGALASAAGMANWGEGPVRLNRGDVLQLMAQSPASEDFGSDLTGTRVEASAPIQVIAGNSCANIPEARTEACDHIEHALLPDEVLGRDYLVAYPAAPASRSPHTVQIVATRDNTTLHFEPPMPSVGDTVVRQVADGPLRLVGVDQDFRVTANHPISVAQFLQGRASVDSGAGDPSMAIVVPVEQYRNDYIVSASSTYDYNFLTVVGSADASVLLDGEPLVDDDASFVGDSAYRVYRVVLPSDRQVFHLQGEKPFGVVVYGYGKFTSYLYPGGLDLKKLKAPVLR